MPTQRPSRQRFVWVLAFNVAAAPQRPYARSLAFPHKPEHGAQLAAACVISGAPCLRRKIWRGLCDPTSRLLTPEKSIWCDWLNICSILRFPLQLKFFTTTTVTLQLLFPISRHYVEPS